jgi:hypothetical protein
VLVVTTLQISYLAGSIMRAAFEKRVPLEGNTDSARHIQENMEDEAVLWRQAGQILFALDGLLT